MNNLSFTVNYNLSLENDDVFCWIVHDLFQYIEIIPPHISSWQSGRVHINSPLFSKLRMLPLILWEWGSTFLAIVTSSFIETLSTYLDLSQHVAGSRLTSNIKITLKITFTSEIFADITRSLVVVLYLEVCKKNLILFFSIHFASNANLSAQILQITRWENRAISLVESSRDNSLIACPTSSG